MRASSAIPLLLALAALPASTRAAESLATCKGYVDSLPATLTTQGTWCLRKDLATPIASGVAITLAASNITLDCNGFKLGGLGAGAGTRTIGVVSNSVLNPTLRRCHIRGFEVGALLFNTSGAIAEDNRFESNTVTGLEVSGSGASLVRRNLVIDTGGSSHPDDAGGAHGLRVFGPNDIRDNVVDGVVHATGVPMGMWLEGQGVTVEGNRVSGIAGPGYGIFINSSMRMVLRRNVLFGPGVYGLFCGASPFIVSNENVISGFSFAYFGGCNPSGDIVN